MKKVSYWDRFMETGAVEDYLKCKNTSFCGEENKQATDRMCFEKEENPDAGFYYSDGNGDKNITRG